MTVRNLLSDSMCREKGQIKIILEFMNKCTLIPIE